MLYKYVMQIPEEEWKDLHSLNLINVYVREACVAARCCFLSIIKIRNSIVRDAKRIGIAVTFECSAQSSAFTLSYLETIYPTHSHMREDGFK